MAGEIVAVHPGEHPPESWNASVFIATSGLGRENSSPRREVIGLFRAHWRQSGRGATVNDTVIALVRESRSSASTADGFVHELPGGSGSEREPIAQAISEVKEETGLAIDASRIQSHGSRQLAATLSAHHAHLFSAEISDAELARLVGHMAPTIPSEPGRRSPR
jgi:ADP-ribose pyrophosphatase YjhB (NUDIX family)